MLIVCEACWAEYDISSCEGASAIVCLNKDCKAEIEISLGLQEQWVLASARVWRRAIESGNIHNQLLAQEQLYDCVRGLEMRIEDEQYNTEQN